MEDKDAAASEVAVVVAAWTWAPERGSDCCHGKGGTRWRPHMGQFQLNFNMTSTGSPTTHGVADTGVTNGDVRAKESVRASSGSTPAALAHALAVPHAAIEFPDDLRCDLGLARGAGSIGTYSTENPIPAATRRFFFRPESPAALVAAVKCSAPFGCACGATTDISWSDAPRPACTSGPLALLEVKTLLAESEGTSNGAAASGSEPGRESDCRMLALPRIRTSVPPAGAGAGHVCRLRSVEELDPRPAPLVR